MVNKRIVTIYKLCLSALFLVIGWLLPLLTGQIPTVGNMLCPMHIPVFLAGFIIGPWDGMLIGFILPLTRSLFFGMPPLYPLALAMAFELATYGLCSGLLLKIFIKIPLNFFLNICLSLIISMIIGRIIWGLARTICGIVSNTPFTLKLFLSGALITAWPGMIIQVIFIPAIIFILSKTKLYHAFNNTKELKNNEL